MSFSEIKYCPSTLAEGFETYSPGALRKLFDGRKVSHFLSYDPPRLNEEVAEEFRQNRKFMSISGVQVKQSFRLEKNQLRLAKPHEFGHYILKPIPNGEVFARVDQLPANENLTMQIASQVYKLDTAANALVFFKNHDPAYITRRFDVLSDDKKVAQEDFASLLGLTRETHGPAFKNEGSYEELAEVIRRFIPAYRVEMEKFYSLVLFNYLFSNGDAHLKNFSVQMTPSGDYILSPAYDLLNTRLHISDDTAMALKGGLFSGGYETESFKVNAYYAYDDFYEFGVKIGLQEKRALRILNTFRNPYEQIRELVNRSYLNVASKTLYLQYYEERLRALNYSYKGNV